MIMLLIIAAALAADPPPTEQTPAGSALPADGTGSSAGDSAGPADAAIVAPETAADKGGVPSAKLSPHSVVEGFVEHVRRSTAFDDATKAFIQKEWQASTPGEGLATFIPTVLAVLHPRFKAGLDAFDAQEYAYCSRIMAGLVLSTDPYLSAHAALFQAKALIQQTQLQYPAILLSYYLREDSDVGRHCLLSDEMTFWLGYCQFHTFESDQAEQTLAAFMERYPDASPAQRATARELLSQLEPPPRKTLGLAAHLMADAGLRLTEGLGDIDTQLDQKKAVLILEDLIAQAEQQEQQQQQQQAGGGGAAQNTSMPSSPATQSNTPGGQTGPGQQHGSPRATPGETWGQMRPQERAKIMQMLQENFPTRYRELVEQYFSDLAKEE